MYFPTIQGAVPAKKIIDVFGGLNKGYDIADNEFSAMKNMSGRYFPCLSTRGRRREVTQTEDNKRLDLIVADHERKSSYDKATGVNFTDTSYDYYYRGVVQPVYRSVGVTLYNNDSGTFNVVAGYPIKNTFTGLLRFGNNVICYPRPEVINQPCQEAYDPAEEAFVCVPAVVSPEEGGTRKAGKAMSLGEKAWGITFTGNQSYFSIRHRALHDNLWTYDNEYVINVSSDDSSAYGKLRENIGAGARLRPEPYTTESGTIETGRRLTLTGEDFGAAYFVVTDFADGGDLGDYIMVRGYSYDGTPLVDTTLDYEICTDAASGVLITELKTDIGLVAVHQNRLWTTDALGTSLYCSNGTDIYDWEIDGTDAGGGFIDVAENTPWTALCEYGGYLYAFKESKLYKVMGSTALDYRAVCVCDIGCTNQEAVCVCDSVLYFLSRDGVYAFTGNLPVKVSEALHMEFSRGVLGARGQRLYCSAEMDTDSGGVVRYDLLVYDTARQMWYMEDSLRARCFLDYPDGLYVLTEATYPALYKLTEDMEELDFSVTTKRYFYYFDQKAVSAANIFLDMSGDSTVTLEISYDSGAFTECGSFSGRTLKYIPVRLKKCDTFQLRLSGKGFVRLKQIEFVVHSGGRTIR